MAASASSLLAIALVALQGGGGRRNAPKAPPPPQYPFVVEPQDALWGHLSQGAFREPVGVFYEPSAKELYVADSKNGLIGIFDSEWTPLFAFGGSTLLVEPKTVHVEADGTIYALDSARADVRQFSYRGDFLATLSFPLPVTSPDEPPQTATVGAFARGADGRWYVVDRNLGRVLVYDATREFAFELPPPARASRFPAPTDIAVSAHGLIAVCDQQSDPAVYVHSPEGKLLSAFGGRDVGLGDFTAPIAVTFDEQGFLYVVDLLRHDVKVYTASGVFVQHFGGWFSPETRGRAAGEMLYPVDIAVAPDGGPIFVAERFGQRVQILLRKPRSTPAPQR